MRSVIFSILPVMMWFGRIIWGISDCMLSNGCGAIWNIITARNPRGILPAGWVISMRKQAGAMKKNPKQKVKSGNSLPAGIEKIRRLSNYGVLPVNGVWMVSSRFIKHWTSGSISSILKVMLRIRAKKLSKNWSPKESPLTNAPKMRWSSNWMNCAVRRINIVR